MNPGILNPEEQQRKVCWSNKHFAKSYAVYCYACFENSSQINISNQEGLHLFVFVKYFLHHFTKAEHARLESDPQTNQTTIRHGQWTTPEIWNLDFIDPALLLWTRDDSLSLRLLKPFFDKCPLNIEVTFSLFGSDRSSGSHSVRLSVCLCVCVILLKSSLNLWAILA